MAVREGETQSPVALTHTNTNEQCQPEGRPAGQDSGTIKTEKEMKKEEQRRGIVCQCHYVYPLTSQNPAFSGHTLPPPSSYTANPNKGQDSASLLRSSFASRRQMASQSLFKGSANPIRLLICEALSPQTPTSAGTTSEGIMGLLVVIGGDRESEGSRHHKASTGL